MKVALSWLHEFLPSKLSAKEVMDALVRVGIEVGSIENQAEGFDGVVVAKIESTDKHPNADKLTLCKVTDGSSQYDIVCGAKNMKAGDCVALAKIGAVLPGDFKIKKSKIRGETSEGMLCSGRELKISDEHEGILVFPGNAPLGQPVAEYLGRQDWVLELELTPNRGDCLSVIGVAREIAASLDVTAKIPQVSGEGPRDSNISVAIHASEGCPRYVLRHIDGLTCKPSPDEIRRKLMASGLRPINALVDITNYVLLEWGQPLHAFDQEKVVGSIQVRWAQAGEKMVGLDEVERSLTGEDLVIADDEGAIAIAGVMGGLRTAVGESTTSILLESAHFNPTCVRKTSRRLGLHTDASHRFERFVDPSATWKASDRAAELYENIAGGRVVGSVDMQVASFEIRKLSLRRSTIERILGEDVKKAGEYLARLGLSTQKQEASWMVEVPTRRPDLEREIDLIEEVARIHGYDQFQSLLPSLDTEPKANPRYEHLDEIRDRLCAQGMYEMAGYSFGAPERETLFTEGNSAAKLQNPLTSDLSNMRRLLIPGMLEAWGLNRSRQRLGANLFEIGTVYDGAEKPQGTPLYESTHLGLVFGGETDEQRWHAPAESASFYHAKGVLESLADQLDWGPLTFSQEKLPSYMHPGRSASVNWRGKRIGCLGVLHPKIQRVFELKDVTVVAEIQLDDIVSEPQKTRKYKRLSPFPHLKRDLAFVLSNEISADQVLNEVRKLKDPLLKDIRLFDRYEGKGVEKGHRSLAYRLTFGSIERTLEDPEVETSVKAIVKHLENKLAAKLR